ncbi:MFS transporter [Oscillospiraceae bacterium MB08-C2-2]|nr:MFS transporter [Oscillospiraceae bacterium MB08-C2-2]
MKTRWLRLSAAVVLLISLGLIYAWSVFVSPLEAEFGWVRAQTTMTFTVVMSCFCLGCLGGGFITAKKSPRLALMLSAVLLFSGFILASRVSTLMGLYLSYGVCIGFGVGLSYNVLINITSRWFPDRKGLASGIMLMGFGLGSMLLSSTATAMMKSIGWRQTFMLFGLIFGGLIALGGLTVAKPPQDFAPPVPEKAAGAFQGLNLPPLKVLQRPSFWLFYFFSIMLTSSGLVVIGHAATAAMDLQANQSTAALSVGVFSICNGLGRILFGLIFDRLEVSKALRVALIPTGLGGALLTVAILQGSLPLLFIGFAFAGFSYGAIANYNSSYPAAFYGMENFGLNFSLMTSNILFSSVLGPYVAAALRDATGTYAASFLAILIMGLAAGVASLFIRKP